MSEPHTTLTRRYSCPADQVPERAEIERTLPDGTVVVGKVESRNVDPCLGVVSFTFLRTGSSWPGAVFTIPIDAHIDVLDPD